MCLKWIKYIDPTLSGCKFIIVYKMMFIGAHIMK